MSRPLAVLVMALMAALPAAARAESAALQDGVLVVTGDAGRDQIQVEGPEPAVPTVEVRDLSTTISAGAGCVQVSSMEASCDPALISAVAVHLGDGNDVLTLQTPLVTYADGGAGNDRFYVLSPGLWGSEGPVRIDGGPGDDGMTGGAKDDVLLGGPGNDMLNGRGGNDFLNPGPGRDDVGDLSGNDIVNTQDGEPDIVDCGPGADLAAVDRIDHVRNCELPGRKKRS